MKLDDFRVRVARVDWNKLHGAYGPSAQVPRALDTLATERSSESDAFMDALDVFQSHVWHQGDIYEVTPFAVPFLLEVAAARPGSLGEELAALLVVIVESARRCPDAALGRAVLDALDAKLLLGWLDGEWCGYGALLALARDDLREPALARLQAHDALPLAALFALARLDVPPAWAAERARPLLSGEGAALRAAAAILLLRSGLATEADAPGLDAALGPGAEQSLLDALELPLELPPFQRPRPERPMERAEVLFAGAGMMVARLASGKNANIRWVDSGLVRGAAIRVALGEADIVRAVEVERADGSVERREFDARGLPT